MFLVRFSLRNPYAVVVLALAILVLGLTALSRIPVDLLPIFKTPAVQVVTFYPGMPAEIMEKDITSRLERWTGQSNGIARQEAKSMIGVSIVKDYFREDIDPNTAMSQVTSLAMSDLFYLPPGTIPPMVMPFDPTASIPLALLSVSSPTFDETQLYDVAYFDLRNRLQGITGVIAPAVYGGKLRRILAYVDRDKLEARSLAPMDVVKALRAYNLMIPTGDAKLGDTDYQIVSNGMVPKVDDLNDIPVKVDKGAPVFVRDVAHAEDTSQIQTNIVRVNGKRQVYIPIYRQPGANTIQIIEGLKDAIKNILSRLPKGINLDIVFDQSVYVRTAIRSLIDEGLLGALLAAGMILIFLGSFRSTLIISLSIPLSILAALTGLYYAGDSINAMTLGGLALAVGRLVDDAIVVLENTFRHLQIGKSSRQAALEATGEVAMPVLVATATTIVVLFPITFLTGIGKFLFTPLAKSVTFAMATSYFMSMMLIPIYCARFFRPAAAEAQASANSAHTGGWGPFERFYRRLIAVYESMLRRAIAHQAPVLVAVLLLFLGSLGLFPLIGKELFPQVDAGQFTVLVRATSGTRVERTEGLIAQVEEAIRKDIPKEDLQMLISNIGVLLDWPAAYTPNSGPQDAFVLVQLTPHHRKSSFDHVNVLRSHLPQAFPGTEFTFDTGGLVTAALNFGLPSPIDIQIEGNKLDVAHDIAEKIKAIAERVPGTADVRIKQKLDYPQIALDVDRVKSACLGLTQTDVVKNVVTALNSSINFDPAFWIDSSNGNHYFVGAQYREKDISTLDTLKNIPITPTNGGSPTLLRNLANFSLQLAPAEVDHLNITRVTDIFVDVAGRDVGSVAADIEKGLNNIEVPFGYFVKMRGEVSSMRESFGGLWFGFALAPILVYLVMVAQFKSFLDPFIIMFAVPLGLIGVLATLFITHTYLNVQSFIGIIFMGGISVSNSVLLVEFANRLRAVGRATSDAAVEAGLIRLRPILMTSIAAVLGLLPMAIGLGHGSEANVPLARAVVGGLTVSTLLTLVVVPVLYTLLKRGAPAPMEEEG